jgi:hypothetical protein
LNRHLDVLTVAYRSGLPGYLTATGRWLPWISGGSGDDAATPPVEGAQVDGANPAAPAPVVIPVVPGLSQDEVNRIAAREKESGKRAGMQSVLETLGVADVKEAKAVIEAARAAEDANKSEMQKAIDKAQAETTRAQQTTTELQQERQSLAAERALLRAGILSDEQVAELVPLVTAKVSESVDAAAAVEQLKVTFPQLFTVPTNAVPPPPSGEPASGGTPPAPRIADARERGRERARRANEAVGKFDAYSLEL